jgi:GTP pyrophosphokinase
MTSYPRPPEPWLYSQRFLDAVTAALTMHAAHVRKSTTIPYASHLLGSCSIALDYGANEDEAIAALLHDAIEDVHFEPRARDAVARFGPEVLRIVEACSDATTSQKPPWRQRKERYVAHLREADRSTLLVSASDKLHNARAILADVRRLGEPVWARFNAGKEGQVWYYRALVNAFRANPAHHPDLVDELDRTVMEIEKQALGHLGSSHRNMPEAPRSSRRSSRAGPIHGSSRKHSVHGR